MELTRQLGVDSLVRVVQLLTAVVTLVAWEVLIGYVGVISPEFIPTPSMILTATLALLGTSDFQGHIYVTLYRATIAAVGAVVIGLLLGLVMGWSDTAKAAMYPPVGALYPLPEVSLLPLFMVILGVGDRAFILTAIFGSVFFILLNVMRGVEDLDGLYIDVARDNGVTSTTTFFREVVIPGSLPAIFTGLRLALSTALVVTLAVEFVGANDGLGYFIWMSYGTFQTANMWAGLVIAAVFGVTITYGLEYLGVKLMPWKEEMNSS